MSQLELFEATAQIPPPMEVDPVLKYAGGKRWAIPHVGKNIWFHLNRTQGRYIEPFLGGASIALWLGLGPRMVLGDACETVINLYTQLRDQPAKVAWALSAYATRGVDKDTYYAVRDEDTSDDPIKRAAQTIYLNKTGFNGLQRVNKQGKFNVPYGDQGYRESTIKRRSRDAIGSLFPHKGKLEAVGRAFAGSQLVRGDFEPLVMGAREDDLLLIDPPYDGGFAAYTADGFDADDQYDLAHMLHEASERGAVVIAFNSDTDLVREIYEPWMTVMPVAESRAINSDGKGRGRVGCVIATNRPELIDGSRK